MASFFSNVADDIKSGFMGAPQVENPNQTTGYERRTADRKRAEAQYQLFHGDEDDKPRQMAAPRYAPPPPKTVEQFYAELSNKANWGPLPSLGMASSGNRNKPSYKDVELREGGEVRSLFQPYG